MQENIGEPSIKPLLFLTYCPLITPSGFSIGTILKIYLFLSSSAIGARGLTASFILDVGGVRRSFKLPRIVQDAFASPGWTLAVRKM